MDTRGMWLLAFPVIQSAPASRGELTSPRTPKVHRQTGAPS